MEVAHVLLVDVLSEWEACAASVVWPHYWHGPIRCQRACYTASREEVGVDQDLERHVRDAAQRAGIALDAERLAALVEQAESARRAAARLERADVGDVGPAGGAMDHPAYRR
jgi:hypothetical protein